MNLVLTIIFGVIGLVGVILTVHFGRKSARLERERKSINWSDVQLAASDLAEKIRHSGFLPSLILAPGARGGIIAEALAQDLGGAIAVVVGITEWKESGLFEGDLSKYECFETNKWKVCIPKCVFDNLDTRILVVDDLTMSGGAMQKIRSMLEEKGVAEDKIRTATIVTTTVAIQNHMAPDFYWKETDSPSFFFPWGKAK